MGFLKRFFRNVFRDGTIPVGTSSFEHLNEEELEAHLGVSRYGNFVLMSHPSTPNDYYSLYGHLSDILVNKGDIVLAGVPVGLAGSTGMIDNSSSRLVLEILKGEAPVNPLDWLNRSNQRASR